MIVVQFMIDVDSKFLQANAARVVFIAAKGAAITLVRVCLLSAEVAVEADTRLLGVEQVLQLTLFAGWKRPFRPVKSVQLFALVLLHYDD